MRLKKRLSNKPWKAEISRDAVLERRVNSKDEKEDSDFKGWLEGLESGCAFRQYNGARRSVYNTEKQNSFGLSLSLSLPFSRSFPLKYFALTPSSSYLCF